MTAEWLENCNLLKKEALRSDRTSCNRIARQNNWKILYQAILWRLDDFPLRD